MNGNKNRKGTASHTFVFGVLPVKRTIKNNNFFYRQPGIGWRYLYAANI